MTFDWWCPEVNPAVVARNPARFRATVLAELEQRARLLFDLKYDRDRAVRRLRDNLAWEFELSKLPGFADEVEKLVDAVYKRRAK
jgi:hypothetical protein